MKQALKCILWSRKATDLAPNCQNSRQSIRNLVNHVFSLHFFILFYTSGNTVWLQDCPIIPQIWSVAQVELKLTFQTT